MQNPSTKKLHFFKHLFFIFLVFFSIDLYSNTLDNADSLFESRKYTKALEQYEKIIEQGKFTPAMLLKMAYMHERLGKYDQAVYYLSIHQAYNFDELVQQKLKSLAAKHQLTGYSMAENESWTFHFHKNKGYIIFLLFITALAILYYLYAQRLSPNRQRVVPHIAFVLVMISIGAIQYFVQQGTRAIINENNTYLMAGPSAAAPMADKVSKGHCVQVLKQEEAWSLILWNEQPCYVRNEKLRII